MAEKFNCPICLDKRHVPTDRGWRPCVCSKHFAELARILPLLRGQEENYPPEYDKVPPYPLADVAVGGGGTLTFAEEYRAFRYMVWRSLRVHLKGRPDFTYDVVEAIKLSFEWFGDGRAEATSTFEEMDLLVLLFLPTVSNMPRRALPDIAAHTLMVRRIAERPTWVFIPDVTSQAAKAFYGEMLGLLPPLQTPTGEPRPVSTALTKRKGAPKL